MQCGFVYTCTLSIQDSFIQFIVFSVGRNRGLHGLAAAILKLWEKSHIAKIAVKWGVPNTDNEQMANELKASLTR